MTSKSTIPKVDVILWIHADTGILARRATLWTARAGTHQAPRCSQRAWELPDSGSRAKRFSRAQSTVVEAPASWL